MSLAHGWIRWWAYAWEDAHLDWIPEGIPGFRSTQGVDLGRAHHMALAKAFAIQPCLPIKPHPALARLTLADRHQREAIWQLVEAACRPEAPGQLNQEQRLWCQRIAKALRTDQWLEPAQDSLHLLHAWVDPGTWQRLRVRFERRRIVELEHSQPLSVSPARLDALWQAVVWRTLAIAG